MIVIVEFPNLEQARAWYRSRAATYVRILTRSIFFALLSVSLTLRPALTGRQAPEGWLISLLPVRGH
jgi:Domain of unknown function (DUF1330)